MENPIQPYGCTLGTGNGHGGGKHDCEPKEHTHTGDDNVMYYVWWRKCMENSEHAQRTHSPVFDAAHGSSSGFDFPSRLSVRRRMRAPINSLSLFNWGRTNRFMRYINMLVVGRRTGGYVVGCVLTVERVDSVCACFGRLEHEDFCLCDMGHT